MMEKTNLKNTLKKYIDIDKRKLDLLVELLLALFTCQTVNMTRLANKIDFNVKNNSVYKRIRRFFKDTEIDYNNVALFVANIIPNKYDKWILALDRTQWEFGSQKINILMLSIIYQGYSFPIMWKMLNKKGNSNYQERRDLLNNFILLFGIDKVDSLIADREFVGDVFFEYLNRKGISIRIRCKNNQYINRKDGKLSKIYKFFRNVKHGQIKILENKRLLGKNWFYIIGTKAPTGEPVVIATDYDPENALNDYMKRWGIETLFKCLKSSGFNFEETHLKDLNRISRLIAVLAIAFTWAFIVGEWFTRIHPIKLKSHGRKEESVFRVGLDFLDQTISHLRKYIKSFRKAIQLLSCT